MIRLAGAAPPPSFCALALVRSLDEDDETKLSSGEQKQERLVRALERRAGKEAAHVAVVPVHKEEEGTLYLDTHTHAHALPVS